VNDRLAATEKFLHEQIPITRAMGLRVIAARRNEHLGDGPDLPRCNDWFAIDLREAGWLLRVALA